MPAKYGSVADAAPAPRIRPLVDAARVHHGADAATRRAAAAEIATAIFRHSPPAKQRHYVEYVVWRLLEPPPG